MPKPESDQGRGRRALSCAAGRNVTDSLSFTGRSLLGRGMPMCGVFGFSGAQQDIEHTVGNALRALEYRGYDSWGVSWTANGQLTTAKKIGRLSAGTLPHARSSAAIGHTRWATHGGVTDANAHPHCGCSGRISVVHNGIIENANALRDGLVLNHKFFSTTDSEVVPHLLEDELANGSDMPSAMETVFAKLEGHNAIVVLDAESDEIYAISLGSPLLLAEGELGSYIGSDIIAFNTLATKMTPLADRTLTRIGVRGVETRNSAGLTWERPSMVPLLRRQIETLGSFQHFTMKEISQQPSVMQRLLMDRDNTSILARELAAARLIVLTGCGSAYFAARFGASWISHLGGTPTLAIPASEMGQLIPFLDRQTLVIALSQSGETADVIDALDLARAHDARVQAIVNVPYSTIARKVERAYPLHAGIEQSVLATKSFIAMLTRLLLAASEMASQPSQYEQPIVSAISFMHAVQNKDVLSERIGSIAARLASGNHAFLIGRGIGFATAQEGALKLKEASYIHAEALAAGELKHGSIALIEVGTPCLIFNDGSISGAQLASTSQELMSRGAHTIGIGMESGAEYSEVIVLPDDVATSPLVHIYVAQRIAYQAALLRGVNPDRPRNLAKSVTVR